MAFVDLARRTGPFVIVFCVGVWLWTLADGFAIKTTLGRAGPDLWPKITLVLLIGAALWGVVEAVFKKRPDDDTSVLIANAVRSAGHEEDARKDLAAEAGDGAEKHPIFAVMGMAAMLGYVAIINYVGFLIATTLLPFAIMFAAGYQRLARAALISLIGALVFFVVFQRIVYVSLPMGAGPFRELSISLMALIGVR